MSDDILDSPSVPSDATILRQAVEFRLGDLHTSMPGKVLAFNAAKNTVKVQPLLQRVFVHANGAEEPQSIPPLEDVPVVYPRAGGFRMSWPLQEGDGVLLVFCERSIDQWSVDGAETVPEPPRKHDLADAVALPGLFPATRAMPDIGIGLTLGLENGQGAVQISPEGEVTVTGLSVALGGPGGAPVARVGDAVVIDGADFLTWLAALASAGPSPVAPFTAPIQGRIVAGSPKVTSA